MLPFKSATALCAETFPHYKIIISPRVQVKYFHCPFANMDSHRLFKASDVLLCILDHLKDYRIPQVRLINRTFHTLLSSSFATLVASRHVRSGVLYVAPMLYDSLRRALWISELAGPKVMFLLVLPYHFPRHILDSSQDASRDEDSAARHP